MRVRRDRFYALSLDTRRVCAAALQTRRRHQGRRAATSTAEKRATRRTSTNNGSDTPRTTYIHPSLQKPLCLRSLLLANSSFEEFQTHRLLLLFSVREWTRPASLRVRDGHE